MKKLSLISLMWLFFLIISHAQSDEFMFPGLDGWKKPDSLNTYKADDLWNIIDGAADGYLVYNFEELTTADYKADNGKYITLEIYRHNSPEDAFGIFSQERPTKAKYESIGSQGYQEDANLNFFSGRYYIKIRCSGKSDEEIRSVRKLALLIAPLADQHPKLPDQLKYFPTSGRIENSEQYINQNFMGYSFMKHAFVSNYTVNGISFNFFIVEGLSPDESKSMLQALFKNNGIDQLDLKPGNFELKDKYNGLLNLLWKDKFLCGIYNCKNKDLALQYIELLNKNLPR